MEIKQFVWNVVDTNSWLMTEGEDGLLVDAVDEPALYEAVRPLKTLTVILTHSHFDHIIGLNRIRELMPACTVLSTRLCSEQIGNRFRNMSSSADAFMVFYNKGQKSGTHIEPFTCGPADITFEDSLLYCWRGHSFRFTAVHGHSADSLLAEADGQFLFTGDTILTIPTVTRLPGGSTRKFREEDLPLLRSMLDMPAYPGHGPAERLSVLLEQYPVNEIG